MHLLDGAMGAGKKIELRRQEAHKCDAHDLVPLLVDHRHVTHHSVGMLGKRALSGLQVCLMDLLISRVANNLSQLLPSVRVIVQPHLKENAQVVSSARELPLK